MAAEEVGCNPTELLIKNKQSYLAEVLMYDRLSQYQTTAIINFRYRTQQEKETELPWYIIVDYPEVLHTLLTIGLNSDNIET